MVMGPMIGAASALSAANIAALSTVWVRNYRQFQTSFVLGLAAFGVAMLLENVLAVYFFFSMEPLYAGDPHVQQVVLLLRAVQFVAVGLLTYVTVK